METDEKKVIQIMPKGLIFLALGGYTGEEMGLNSKENTDKVIKSLTDYLKTSNTAIMVIDDRLLFVALKEGKRKKILGIF